MSPLSRAAITPTVAPGEPFPAAAPAVPHRPLRTPRRRNARPTRPGFTLIEVMVVIVVIAVLATLVAPNVFRHVGSAKDATARSQIEMLGAALDGYRLDVGHYPTTADGLDALWQPLAASPAGQWRGPYLKKAVPPDPWQHPYIYRAPGTESRTGYDLLSLGADGKPGGEGDDADIASWK